MDMQRIIEDVLSIERWQKRLPQMVAENYNSAYLVAKVLARRYNELYDLYPVSPEPEPKHYSTVPRLVKR